MDDDFELEEELRRAADILDPLPPHLLRAAIESYAFRTVDAELAELTFDSLADPELVRGTDRPRLLMFGASVLTIEVEVTGTGTARRIVGRLIPAEAARVDIRRRDHVSTVTTDALGQFVADLPGAGPFSLRCGGVVTEWFSA